MFPPLQLTVSGAGFASAPVPNGAAQLVCVCPQADPSVALSCKLYTCPSAPVEGELVAGSTLIAPFQTAAGTIGQALNLAPDGVRVGGSSIFVVSFSDTGAGHSLFLFLK